MNHNLGNSYQNIIWVVIGEIWLLLLIVACTSPLSSTKITSSTDQSEPPVLPEQMPSADRQPLQPNESTQWLDCRPTYPNLPDNFRIITNTGQAQLAVMQYDDISLPQLTLINLTNGHTWRVDQALFADWSPSGHHLLLELPANSASTSMKPPFWTPSAVLPATIDWLAWPTKEGALLAYPIPAGSPCQILPPGTLPNTKDVVWSTDNWLAWTSDMVAPPPNEALPQTLFLRPVEATTDTLTWQLTDDIRQTYYRLIDWVPETRFILAAQGFMGASVWADGLPLITIQADTGDITDLESVMPLTNEAYAWHPNQPGHLAFIESNSRFRTDESRLALLDVTTGDKRYLTTADLTAFEPNWSPDGRLLAYTAAPLVPDGEGDGKTLEEQLNGRAIYVIDLDSGETRQVTFPGDKALDGWPQWLPTGTGLLYARRQAGQTEIRVVLLDTLEDEVKVERLAGPEWCYYGGCGWQQWLAYQ